MTPRRRRDPVARAIRAKRRTGTFFAVLAVAIAAVIAVSAGTLVSAYGRWKYETGRESLALPGVQAPCCVEASIKFDGLPPEDIRIECGGIPVNGVQYDVSGGMLNAWLDVPAEYRASSADWTLSLAPMDNAKLSYAVRVLPSYAYADLDVRFLTEESSDLYLYVKALYGRLREGESLRTVAYLEHADGTTADSIFVWRFDGDGGVFLLNLSETMRRKNLAADGGDSVSITVMGGGQDRDGNPLEIGGSFRTRLDEWPDAASDWDGLEPAPDITKEYLSRTG